MRLASAVAIACAACTAPPEPSVTESPSSTATLAPSSASPAAPRSASDLLDCDGRPSDMGGRADDFGPDGGGDSPDEAFTAWVAENPFGVPRSGYRALGSVGDRAVYVYELEGRAKVVVVISPRFGEMVGAPFTIEEMRTCDPSEYGADVDLGSFRRAWTHVDTGELLFDIEGPGHCEWQSARLLHTTADDGTLARQYVRDPLGLFVGHGLLDDYAEGVDLPTDAFDSGYRTATGMELWFTEADTAAYVVTPDGVERWPRAPEPIGCA